MQHKIFAENKPLNNSFEFSKNERSNEYEYNLLDKINNWRD